MRVLNNSKKSLIIFLTFAATIAIFSIHQIFTEFQLLKARRLAESYEAEICDKAPDSLFDNYAIAAKDYKSSITETENAQTEYLIGLIRDQSMDSLKDNLLPYAVKIIYYFIILFLDIIILLIWIFSLIFWCCCCPCGCFKQKEGGGTCCRNCSFVMQIICSGCLVCICVAGILLGPKFFKGYNGTICSGYKIVSEFNNGETGIKVKADDTWVGMNKILEMISNLDQEVKKINPGQEKAYLDEVDNAVNNLGAEPRVEYENFLLGFRNSLEKGSQATTIIQSAKATIEDALEKSRTSILNIQSTINQVHDDYLDKIGEYSKDYVNKYLLIFFYSLFGAFIFLGILAFVSILIFVCCNSSCIKCLYYVVWNLEMLFTFLTIILGCIFGIIARFGKDSIYVAKFIVSEENLKSSDPLILNVDNEIKDLVSTCFNGDGDLRDLLDLRNVNSTEKLQDLLDLSKKMSNMTDVLKTYKDQLSFSENKQIAQSLLNGFSSLNSSTEIVSNFAKNFEINQNIFGFVNCLFLKRDVNILLDQLHDLLAKRSLILAILILSACLFSLLSVIFGLVVILRSVPAKGNDRQITGNSNAEHKVPIAQGQEMDFGSSGARFPKEKVVEKP